MFIFRYIISILLVATLTSCGGGSGSSNNESADGYWEGRITDSYGDSSEVVFFSSGGEFIAVGEDNDVIVSGSLSIRGAPLILNEPLTITSLSSPTAINSPPLEKNTTSDESP